MTPELTVLALAALLQAAQYTVYAALANMQVGPRVALGPRDTPVLLTGLAGRMQRAMNNHFEGLILFTIAVVVCVLGDKTTGFSGAMAWTYLAARILYVPAYGFGLAASRSIIWLVGFLATLAIIVSALVF